MEEGRWKNEEGRLKIEDLPCGSECLTYDYPVAYVNGVSEVLFKVGAEGSLALSSCA